MLFEGTKVECTEISLVIASASLKSSDESVKCQVPYRKVFHVMKNGEFFILYCFHLIFCISYMYFLDLVEVGFLLAHLLGGLC